MQNVRITETQRLENSLMSKLVVVDTRNGTKTLRPVADFDKSDFLIGWGVRMSFSDCPFVI
jgi:hypothetical protein